MRKHRAGFLTILLLCAVARSATAQTESQNDPLASWNDGEVKSAIVSFVERVTDENSPDFVPPEHRIATFDNDGTLWAEQPAYFQALFAIDRVKAMAADHPEWTTKEPFRSVISGNLKGLSTAGEKGMLEVVMATHSGMTTDEFNESVRQWITTARHPTTKRPYTQMVYQPMLELLAYLRAHEFKTFIVSGGGVEFMRVFAEEVYGVPPEQVVGSSGTVSFEMRGGAPTLIKQPQIDFIDDKEGKPVAINRFIGRRPIFAVGNSDGDLQMLQYTTINQAPSFGLIVHHTDPEREWAYDRDSRIGRLDKALDEAKSRQWIVVDMKRDWSDIFVVEKAQEAYE